MGVRSSERVTDCVCLKQREWHRNYKMKSMVQKEYLVRNILYDFWWSVVDISGQPSFLGNGLSWGDKEHKATSYSCKWFINIDHWGIRLQNSMWQFVVLKFEFGLVQAYNHIIIILTVMQS